MANIPQNGAEGLNLKVVIDMNDSGNGVALSEEQERAVDVLMSERGRLAIMSAELPRVLNSMSMDDNVSH